MNEGVPTRYTCPLKSSSAQERSRNLRSRTRLRRADRSQNASAGNRGVVCGLAGAKCPLDDPDYRLSAPPWLLRYPYRPITRHSELRRQLSYLARAMLSRAASAPARKSTIPNTRNNRKYEALSSDANLSNCFHPQMLAACAGAAITKSPSAIAAMVGKSLIAQAPCVFFSSLRTIAQAEG